jgi:hypothetical protein
MCGALSRVPSSAAVVFDPTITDMELFQFAGALADNCTLIEASFFFNGSYGWCEGVRERGRERERWSVSE